MKHGGLGRQEILQVELTGGPRACQESQKDGNATVGAAINHKSPLATQSPELTQGLPGDMD